jgi:FAD/FMN-containing dehydrogenase
MQIGTFGVVTSLVVKAHPKITLSALTFNYTTIGTNLTVESFWASTRAYFKRSVAYADAGTVGYFRMTGSETWGNFSMTPFFGPNMTKTELQTLLAPYLAELRGFGVQFEPVWYEWDNFSDGLWTIFSALETGGKFASKTASRLFPRENWSTEEKFNDTFSAIKASIIAGGRMLAYNFRPAPSTSSPNAINPAWRNAVMFAIMAAVLEDGASDETIIAQSKWLSRDLMKYWRDATPGGGTYMNEADTLEPNFQQSFFGSNYASLLELKRKYDPWDAFYAHMAVGSEDWYVTGQVDGLPTQNGRLCRA